MKIRQAMIKTTLFLLALSFSVHSEMRYGEVNGSYRIYGSVEPKFHSTFNAIQPYMAVKLTDNSYIYAVIKNTCWDYNSAFKLANKLLSGQGVAATLVHGKLEYSHYFLCEITSSRADKYVYYDNDPVAAPTDCKVDIPTNVEFGEVSMGNSGVSRRLEGSLSCDYKASVALSLSGAAISGSLEDKQINVGDALVGYAFDNGKVTTTVSTENQ